MDFRVILISLFWIALGQAKQCPAATVLSQQEHSDGTQYWFTNLEASNNMALQQILPSGAAGWSQSFTAQIGSGRVQVINNAGDIKTQLKL